MPALFSLLSCHGQVYFAHRTISSTEPFRGVQCESHSKFDQCWFSYQGWVYQVHSEPASSWRSGHVHILRWVWCGLHWASLVTVLDHDFKNDLILLGKSFEKKRQTGTPSTSSSTVTSLICLSFTDKVKLLNQVTTSLRDAFAVAFVNVGLSIVGRGYVLWWLINEITKTSQRSNVGR